MKFYFVPYHIVKDKIKNIIENNKDDFLRTYGEVEVDYDHFETLSAMGMVFMALAVEEDVKGFAGFVVNHNATHKGVEAENIVMFFDKNSRDGKLIKDLINFSKKEFLKIGINKITVTIKSDALARMLKGNDFVKQYEIWESDFG